MVSLDFDSKLQALFYKADGVNIGNDGLFYYY